MPAQLVLRERRAAARAPLGRAVAEVEPAPLVHDLQEPPDVLDVRVGEREVVVAPVHPLAEADRAARQLAGRPDDDLAARARELLEPVLLDLALRVEAELPLDADLDPEPLAVEAVLVALVEAAQRLVALEDVLQRPPPRRVDGERLVRRHRPVDEAPARAAARSARAAARTSARAPRSRGPRARARGGRACPAAARTRVHPRDSRDGPGRRPRRPALSIDVPREQASRTEDERNPWQQQ